MFHHFIRRFERNGDEPEFTGNPRMTALPHSVDISEDNKENLPPWLIMQQQPIWDRSRDLVSPPSIYDRANWFGKAGLQERSAAETLFDNLDGVPIVGRGGEQPRSSTLPSPRHPRPYKSRFTEHFDITLDPDLVADDDDIYHSDEYQGNEHVDYEMEEGENMAPTELTSETFDGDLAMGFDIPRFLPYPGGNRQQSRAQFQQSLQDAFPTAAFELLAAGFFKNNRGMRRSQSMPIPTVSHEAIENILDNARDTSDVHPQNSSLTERADDVDETLE